jgi:hypothetical protein
MSHLAWKLGVWNRVHTIIAYDVLFDNSPAKGVWLSIH